MADSWLQADVAQLVEHSLGKLSRLAGVSEARACWRNPERSEGARFRNSGYRWTVRADVAQLVEHSLGKGEVTSSILVIGSRNWERHDFSRAAECGIEAALAPEVQAVGVCAASEPRAEIPSPSEISELG